MTWSQNLNLLLKFITVDSKPINDFPPFKINLILFLNSSTTSNGSVGLTPVDIFALGIAKGKTNFLINSLIILFFGNLTAIVFSLALANFDTFDFFLF